MPVYRFPVRSPLRYTEHFARDVLSGLGRSNVWKTSELTNLPIRVLLPVRTVRFFSKMFLTEVCPVIPRLGVPCTYALFIIHSRIHFHVIAIGVVATLIQTEIIIEHVCITYVRVYVYVRRRNEIRERIESNRDGVQNVPASLTTVLRTVLGTVPSPVQ